MESIERQVVDARENAGPDYPKVRFRVKGFLIEVNRLEKQEVAEDLQHEGYVRRCGKTRYHRNKLELVGLTVAY